MRTVVLAALVMGVGCGDEQVDLPGPHYQYVMRDLKVPKNNNEARANGLDLDGDKIVDNQLGMVFSSLSAVGFGVDGAAREAVQRGGLILLADLQTIDLEASTVAGLTTYLGSDPSPAPCLDPARLETCGQQLFGDGSFSIEPASGSGLGIGPIRDGMFSASMGDLPVELALDVNAPLRLDLHMARVKLTELSETGFVGVIGGVITQADIDGVIVPQAAIEIRRIFGLECGQADGRAPCGCISGSRSSLLQESFDKNDDCEVTLAEVQTSSFVQSLVAPDFRLDGGGWGLSFGIGVELVPATFE